MNKKYLSYLFRSRKMFLIFYYVLFLALCLTPFLSSQARMGNQFSNFDAVKISLIITIFGSCLLAGGLPLLQFAFVHYRKSVDSYFSLPVKRSQQLITNILFVWIVSCGMYLLNSALAISLYNNVAPIATWNVLEFLLVPLFMLLVITLCCSAWYLLANNIFDGFVMVGAYAVLPFVLALLVSTFTHAFVAGYPYNMDLVLKYISPLVLVANNFFTLLNSLEPETIKEGVKMYSSLLFDGSRPLIDMVIMFAYCSLSAFLCHRHFVKRKTERAEQVSGEFLAYPFIIGIYTTATLMKITFSAARNQNLLGFVKENSFFYVAILLIYIIANFVYRRRIELKRSTVVLFVCSFLSALAISHAAWHTRGFGIADIVPIPDNNVRYMYYGYLAKEDYAKFSASLPSKANTYFVDVNVSLLVEDSNHSAVRKVVTLLEKMRREAITDFYQRGKNLEVDEQDSRNYHTGSLYIIDLLPNSRFRNYFNELRYDIYQPLTLKQIEELQTDKNLEVSIGVATDESYDTYTVKQFKEAFNIH